MHLRVQQGGEVVVSAGLRMPKYFIEAFVRKNTQWIEKEKVRVAAVAATPLGTESREAYLAHKERARALTSARAKHFASLYGVSFNRIAIRNTKSCWGSCSRKGNLNFSYKLVHLPPHLADYVIVHEVCHLKEMNHSLRFWKLVAQECPEYEQCRRELRRLHF